MKMTFKLSEEDYQLLVKYTEFDEMDYIFLNDEKNEITINEKELLLFQTLVSEASSVYGFDADYEITPLGRRLEAIYDKLYDQT